MTALRPKQNNLPVQIVPRGAYVVTYQRPQELPTTTRGSSLRDLLKDVRHAVARGPSGMRADVEHEQNGERFPIASYENVEGRLRKL